MKIARLGAAGAAAGVLAIGAAGPAFATGASPAPSAGLEQDTTTPSATPGPKAPAQQPTADVNPKFFYGGDTLTFTVKHCPVHPTITDVNDLFVTTHPFASTGTAGSFAAKETTRKNIVEGKKYRVVVKCDGYTVTFSTNPRKRTSPTPTTQPTGVPSGAPQTGDGSGSGGGNTGLMAAGAGIVVLGLAGGGFLYTRRRSSAGA
jgi:hypothetical protein